MVELTDWIAAREADAGFNWAFYDSVERGRILFDLAGFPEIDEALPGLEGSVDWLGINDYRRNLVRFSWGAPGLVTVLPGPGPLSDAGVEIYPAGLLRLVRRAWERYGLPIYVTENGVADSGGKLRAGFVQSHAYAVGLALGEGIDMRGYFHCSLLDNFEWTEGFGVRFGVRFGLYRVDWGTLERTVTGGGKESRRVGPVRIAPSGLVP